MHADIIKDLRHAWDEVCSARENTPQQKCSCSLHVAGCGAESCIAVPGQAPLLLLQGPGAQSQRHSTNTNALCYAWFPGHYNTQALAAAALSAASSCHGPLGRLCREILHQLHFSDRNRDRACSPGSPACCSACATSSGVSLPLRSLHSSKPSPVSDAADRYAEYSSWSDNAAACQDVCSVAVLCRRYIHTKQTYKTAGLLCTIMFKDMIPARSHALHIWCAAQNSTCQIFKAHKALAEQRYEYSCASPTALSPALQLPVECLKAVLHVDQEVVQAGKLRKS